MKHLRILALALCMTFLLTACMQGFPPVESTHSTIAGTLTPPEAEPSATETVPTETTVPTQSTETIPTEPEHSPLYIPDVPVEDVILYFNEVVLDSEFINSGDPSFVQKWVMPIFYTLEGDYTQEDIVTLNAFADWLNRIDGFPGIFYTEDPDIRNLQICFCSQQEMINLLGPNFEFMDGGVTFWYDYNEIYCAIICYRNDLDQHLRNCVILEEIYNGLGPVQDTSLRPDSIIYQDFSQPQWLTPIDELILRLLYHPDMRPGMNAAQCAQVIRSLYY